MCGNKGKGIRQDRGRESQPALWPSETMKWDDREHVRGSGTRLEEYIWVRVLLSLLLWLKRTKKQLCTCDTPWIPPETTMRPWGGCKSYVMQVGTKASDIWLATVTSPVLTGPGNLGPLHSHLKAQNEVLVPGKKEPLFSPRPPEKAGKNPLPSPQL